MYILKTKVNGEFAQYGKNIFLKLDVYIMNKGMCNTRINNITIKIINRERELDYQIQGDKYENAGTITIFLKDYINIFKIEHVLKSQEKIVIKDIFLKIDEIPNEKTIKGFLVVDTEASIFKIKKYKFKPKKIDKFDKEPNHYLVPKNN